jgi:hypothetical protein
MDGTNAWAGQKERKEGTDRTEKRNKTEGLERRGLNNKKEWKERGLTIARVGTIYRHPS